MDMFDFNELVKRVVKYLVEGIVVALVAFAVPKKSLNVEEVVIIALTAAATFSILDVFILSKCSPLFCTFSIPTVHPKQI